MSGSAETHDGASWRPGSQPERTALAWVRTSIAIFVSAGAAARVAALDDLVVLEAVALVGACACLLSMALWGHRFRRAAESPGLATDHVTASSGAMAAAVVAVLAVCTVGVVASSLSLAALLR